MFQVGKAMATAVRMWMNVWPIMAAVPPLLWCNAWTPWVPSTVVPALQVWGEKSYRCNYSSMNSGWPTETVCNTYHACISIMCVCRRSWPYINLRVRNEGENVTWLQQENYFQNWCWAPAGSCGPQELFCPTLPAPELEHISASHPEYLYALGL